jgi:hypothetical protein
MTKGPPPTAAILTSSTEEKSRSSPVNAPTLAHLANNTVVIGHGGTADHILSILSSALLSRGARDSRLAANLETISSFRHAKDGWDGRDAIAPSQAALNAAEMLSAHFSGGSGDNRLHLMIGTDGRPAFAVSSKGDYIHLAIDPGEPGSNHHLAKLSWYTVHNGQEEFVDEVPFDGRELPDNLRQLLK